MNLPKLYYITQPIAGLTYSQQVEQVCQGGVRLIQLRIKNISEEEYMAIVLDVKLVTDRYQATLIVNDNITIACAANASGVHVGLHDISPPKARKLLLPRMLLGGTANTFERIQEIYPYVDYIGLGPFRFTTTKQNLSPILGIEGYSRIMQQMREQGMTKPVYAIGGIEPEDICSILETGVHGIALSSTIAKAVSISEAAASLIL